MAAIVPVLADVVQSGDRSCSVAFASAAAADTLSAATLAGLLEVGSTIRSFLAAANALNDFRDEGVQVSLISAPTVPGTPSSVEFDGANFLGFVAGNHVLRVSLSYSASA